jgi:hypothetical protein
VRVAGLTLREVERKLISLLTKDFFRRANVALWCRTADGRFRPPIGTVEAVSAAIRKDIQEAVRQPPQ